MRRAVITGMGIVSPLGNDLQATLASLKSTTSGITYQPEYEEMGLRSHIAGSIDIDQDTFIDRKLKRFMGDAAAFSYIAMQEAINDSGLEPSDVSSEMTGIIAGSGVGIKEKTSEIPISSDEVQQEDISYRLVQLGHGFSLVPVSNQLNHDTNPLTSTKEIGEQTKESSGNLS